MCLSLDKLVQTIRRSRGANDQGRFVRLGRAGRLIQGGEGIVGDGTIGGKYDPESKPSTPPSTGTLSPSPSPDPSPAPSPSPAD